MAQTFTDQNIHSIIESGRPVLVDFWATWCGPCQAMSPIIDKLAEEYQGRVEIGKYNCDDETEFATENRVMALPTIILFRDGQRVTRLAGSQTPETLRQKLDALPS